MLKIPVFVAYLLVSIYYAIYMLQHIKKNKMLQYIVLNKYKNIKRECNKKVNYYKIKMNWNLRKEFNLKVKKQAKSKNLNENKSKKNEFSIKFLF